MDELETRRLGVSSGTVKIDTLEACREAALALARQAQRSIHILSRDLDPRLFDTAEFVAEARRLASSHRQAIIRVLVRETDTLIKRDHRFIELGRRLSSYIQIRKLCEDDRDINEAFLIADGAGFLHRPLGDRFEGVVSFNDPPGARERLRLFTRCWELAERDPQLLRLHI